MNKLPKFTLLFFTLAFSTAVFSQTNCITPKGGGSIVDFEEDSLFLWIATNDSGLIRFNKQTEVKTYYNTTNSNISSNKILSLLYYNSELIVSTDSNLLRFTNNNFTTINDSTKGLMIEDLNGNLVIVEREDYFKGNIYILQNNSIIQQTDVCSAFQYCLNNNDITIDSSGNIWVVRSEFYAFDVGRFDGANYQSFSAQDFPGDAFNPSISSNGNLVFMSNYKGIFSYNGTWQFTIPYEQIIDGTDTLNQYLTSIEVESNGNLWAGTNSGISGNQPGRIIYLNNSVWEFLPQTDSLASTITTFHLSKYDTNIVYVGSTNGFMVIDKSCLGLTSTNVKKNIKKKRLKIYPNPVKETLRIELKKSLIVNSIFLFNLNGELIKTFSKKSLILNLSELPKGQYILKIESDEEVLMESIIKE